MRAIWSRYRGAFRRERWIRSMGIMMADDLEGVLREKCKLLCYTLRELFSCQRPEQGVS